ncbi:pentatricopeptide repeat-containing protein At2g04860-like [Amaranthus tricolor]|uniref:pentatricopeptide repeat-containing protein At2g04860-like n=1 Tax=Amaranthus tricolor TaxID=29722 RepID=UPI002589EA72|nr:pentatricopeptide repeat-containing protein At2g04860-like [Amaranthus tricolor]
MKLKQCLYYDHIHLLSNLYPLHCRKFATFSSPQSHVQSIIKLCKRVEDLKPLISLIIVDGLFNYKHVISEFIEKCIHLDAPELALSAFYASQNRSLLLQNLIIKHLCNLGLYQDVINVYKSCKLLGTSDGNYTFPYVIKGCSAVSDEKLGKEIHGVVIRTGYDRNTFVQTAFICFYARIQRMDIAHKLFDKMSEWDVVSWNALISGYSYNGLDYDGIKVFHDYWMKGVKPNVATLASIVPICTRLSFRNLGRSLHTYSVKSGFYQDELLIPALISMYASNNDIHAAKSLFDLSPMKNVVVWNSMIYAYAQKMPEVALEMFQQMVSDDFYPNSATFVSVIPCCEKLNSVCHGGILHGCVVKNGLDNHISVATTLISMYEKSGSIGSAENVFTWAPQKNLHTWNSIMSAYVHHGLSRLCLDSVYKMQLAGFDPDPISIVNVLSACSELKALLQGKSAHALSIRKGFDSNINVSNSLLAFYTNCHQLHSSFKLFDLLPSKTTISWNTMISGCVYNGENEKAASYFQRLQLEDVQLDVVSLISIISGLNETVDLAQGTALHGLALKFGFDSDVTLSNALINMYCSCRNLESASLLLHTMSHRCLVSWNSLITGYRCHNLHEEVISLFKEMISYSYNPNYVTLLNLLPGCPTLLQGKSIHCYAIKIEAIYRAPFLTSLICMYSKFNHLISCFRLFETGDKIDISLWNVMLSVFLEGGNAGKVFSHLRKLLQSEVKVDHVTIVRVISACSQLSSITVTNFVLAFVIKNGFVQETIVSNAFIDLYAKCGDIPMARKVFECLVYKDAVSWSTIINAYGLHGDCEGAISLLFEMEDSGMKPDSITYLSILSACSHAGLAYQGKIIINSMLKNGIQPGTEHFSCVVNLLGRKGLLSEAYDIVNNMSGGVSVSVLEALLGACMVHGNVEIGEKVGESIIHKDPKNGRTYVILHNIYAGAGRWEDANTIRCAMEEEGLNKVVGFSMVPIAGTKL